MDYLCWSKAGRRAAGCLLSTCTVHYRPRPKCQVLWLKLERKWIFLWPVAARGQAQGEHNKRLWAELPLHWTPRSFLFLLNNHVGFVPWGRPGSMKPLETLPLLWGASWGCVTKLSLSRGWRESVSSMSSHGFTKHS